MPKKMKPKSQAKKKTYLHNTHFLTIFNTKKNYHASKYTVKNI